jgi:hypothetical protein
MALLSPVKALLVPFLVMVTLPLATFAAFTTLVAFGVLLWRVLLVYLDLILQLIPFWPNSRRQPFPIPSSSSLSPLPGSRHGSGQTSPTTPHAFPAQPGEYRPVPRSKGTRRRRTSSAGQSTGSITPMSEAGLTSGAMPLIPAIDLARDFEGVGGWRLDDGKESWAQINSRLELPGRNHQRSQSGGLTVPGPSSRDRVLVSPNSSRVRTVTSGPLPLTSFERSGSYFNEFQQPGLGRRVAA